MASEALAAPTAYVHALARNEAAEAHYESPIGLTKAEWDAAEVVESLVAGVIVLDRGVRK